MLKKNEINYSENERFVLNRNSSTFHYFKNNFGNMLRIYSTGENAIVSVNNVIGVVKVENTTYRFFSKIDEVLSIFSLIEKISATEYKFKVDKRLISFDPKQKITIAKGTSLLLQLVDVLINELFKLRNIGYTRDYNLYTGNIDYLKGRLDINNQIKENIIPKKFYCNYYEMNYVTPENLIVYKTVNKILDTLKISNEQKQNLIMFKNEIENALGDVNPRLLQQDYIFRKTRINKHYEDVINICEMFLQTNYYSNISDGENIFCNFLINIDIVFERYLFLLIKELIDEFYVGYEVEEQVDLNVFERVIIDDGVKVAKGYLKMIPDIVIYEKHSNIPVVVIDTKYIDMTGKQKLNNNAYYQTINYMLGLYIKNNKKSGVDGVLLVHGEKGNSYKIDYGENKNMYIYTEAINILEDESTVKSQLKTILDRLLLNK